ncbi:MAG: response regulator transcription factor [Burkholderiales bacterium]|nr:response regulator transcription factor [Burkholderiales bacterium]
MIRILLVDDHTILREGLKQILADCHDMVVGGEADNGHDALSKIREDEWGVVVLDMSIPGRSGIELIRLIKAEKPRLPILILSMHKEDQYAVRTLRAGASGYLSKDSASGQLVFAIRKVASGGIYLSPGTAEKLAFSFRQESDALPHTLLSDREYQIFLLLVHGKNISEIAEELHLSVKTVSTHKTRILQKMGVDNLPALVKYAIRQDLIDSGELS